MRGCSQRSGATEPIQLSAMSVEPQAELSQALVQCVADALIFADRDGSIRVWNPGAEAIFGYTEAEALGQRLDLIIPERFRSAHWTAFDRAIATGQTKYGREALTTKSVTKAGADLYLDLSFALVTDDVGEVLGAVAMARDATGRHTADRELRKRVVELEAQLKARS
jgi:PAS domain S-box-containing protein